MRINKDILIGDTTTTLEQINTNKTNITKLQNKVLIFTGSSSSGTTSTINTNWSSLGQFKELEIELFYSAVNTYTIATIPYEIISSSTDLYSGARLVNVNIQTYANYIHFVPKNNIGTNSITFDGYTNYAITRMWVIY